MNGHEPRSSDQPRKNSSTDNSSEAASPSVNGDAADGANDVQTSRTATNSMDASPTQRSSAHTTLAEIAEALKISRPAAEKRARKEAWPRTEKPARGGMQFLFPLDAIPKGIARKVLARRGIAAAKAAHRKAEKPLPDSFLLVIGEDVFEVRRVQP